jgi:hypothetical protein
VSIPVCVGVDRSLETVAEPLGTLLGDRYLVTSTAEPPRVGYWVTADPMGPVIHRRRSEHARVVIIVATDASTPHDHARLLAALNAGVDAYLVHASVSSIATHVRHVGHRRLCG